ncbi:NADAR family protein [Dawidia cretensis]|uniref:NADAR family protein n=1 Tax=Dawidia cretensis TaxID=2782350 RepID=UPI0020B36361|nr:NADAR family protein [Dawidia cretensis]
MIDKFEKGETIKYLFFWGHTNKKQEDIGKFVLSQWYPSPFIVDNVEYKTAEHWMMAQKANLFGDYMTLQKILTAVEPGEAKKLGRQISGFDEIEWDKRKFEIVKTGSIHKFHQNKKLRNFLIGTANRIIVEASPVDAIWGVGMSEDANLIDMPHAWEGENLLGFALMEARDFLIETGDFRYTESDMLPPWKRFPNIDPHDMFWRMGGGEQYVMDLGDYFRSLSGRDKKIYQLTYPSSGDWIRYYDHWNG